jgi:hypothetical protein
MSCLSRLGGVVVSVLARPRRLIFKGDKTPQHTFLRMGSKAGGPCREILRPVVDILKSQGDG